MYGSRALGDSCNDLIAKARSRWSEKSIVYTRRNHKKPQKSSIDNDVTAADDADSCAAVSSPTATGGWNAPQDSREAAVTKNDDNGSLITELRNPGGEYPLPTIISDSGEVAEALRTVGNEADNDGESGLPQGHNDPVNANKVMKPLVLSIADDRIRVNLSKATPKSDIKELKRMLLDELNKVSILFNQLESTELRIVQYNNTQVSNSNLSNGSTYISGNSHLQHTRNEKLSVRVNSDVSPRETRLVGLTRVNSDMGAAWNMDPRPYSRQLSVSVMENDNMSVGFVENEKRTPKANQFYRSSEFLLGKDMLPSESNKKLKTNNGRRHSGEVDHTFGFGFEVQKNMNHVFKNCSSILQRLMKHKHGWVFNEPVNANALGLADYHDIIKHPMDLGTIKTRLAQNWYKSPIDFAEDVRLVFSNAMTYNPKGHDVHIMAEQLLDVFEERWANVEAEYTNLSLKNQTHSIRALDRPLPQSHFAPSSVVSAPVSLFAPVTSTQIRAFDRPSPMVTSMAVDPKVQRPHAGRPPVPRKPKAKDPDKRDMTVDEKQRLSTNLQGLPSEKLDAIVQIIKKGNTTLSQHDDEIEVDIDSVNTETLWELDRFVTNYKKNLSKIRRKAKLALQSRTVDNQDIGLMNSVPSVADQIARGAAFKKSKDPSAEGEKQGYNGSSSSSSSSDSGSSSSESDSDSSSTDGSEAMHSPKS